MRAAQPRSRAAPQKSLLRALRASALCALLLPGCAYYNSMYYAKRYAKEAERAERQGRAADAADRWRLAAVHADSQVARHPRSRWTDDALIIRGRAALHRREWSDAVVVLERAARQGGSVAEQRRARLYLGEAKAGLRLYHEALADLDSAVQLEDEKHRGQALLQRGRVLLELGRSAEALADLRASNAPEAMGARVRAALALGDAALAAAFSDTLSQSNQPFREAVWLPVLDTLSRAGLGDVVAELVNRLARRNDAGSGMRARLFLSEGERRLTAGDTLAAVARFRAVQAVAGDSVESRAAALRLLRLELATTRDPAVLREYRPSLEQTVGLGGDPARDAIALLRLLNQADTLLSAEGPRDAYWFYRAELLRDSLGARALAAHAFASMVDRFPESPWTPKALIAAMAAGHPASDSLEALLGGRYAASPYAQVMSDAPEIQAQFRQLEDSLQLAIASGPVSIQLMTAPNAVAPPTTPRPNQPQQPRPAGGRRTVEP